MRNDKTLNIVRGGIFTALGLVFIYMASIFPTNKLFFLGIASAVMPICILTSGIKYGFLVYTATSILSALLPVSKGVLISYILFFGIYGIMKYYIESLKKIPYEILLKLIFFNAALSLSLFIYKLLFLSTPSFKFPVFLIFIGLQLIFLVYDYILTIFIYRVTKYLGKNA